MTDEELKLLRHDLLHMDEDELNRVWACCTNYGL